MLARTPRVSAPSRFDEVRRPRTPVDGERLLASKRGGLCQFFRRFAVGGAGSFSDLRLEQILRESETLEALPRCNSSPSLRTSDTYISPFRATQFEVFGLGEAMIDFSACVADELLEEFNLEKGTRRVISAEERQKILAKLGDDVVIQAGSSMTNTLVAMAQLSGGMGEETSIGFAGCIGSDHLGRHYLAHLSGHGIEAFECAAEQDQKGFVGCSIVLITSDAQRSLLVCPGQGTLNLTPQVKQCIANAKVLMIEGYLFGMKHGAERIKTAVSIAKRHGVDVAVTAGSADVVRHALQEFWEVIKMGVDVLLCSQPEAAALLGRTDGCCAHEAVRLLSLHVPIVAVTDGANGSYIAAEGRLQTVPPYWLAEPPVDTCGAGDVYAAGLMHGLLRGYDLHDIGFVASRSASAITQRRGVHLSDEDIHAIITDIAKTKKIKALKAFPQLELDKVKGTCSS